jgi:hypothetical protein
VKDNSHTATLPIVFGNVGFRGDDPALPLQLCVALSRHANETPSLHVHVDCKWVLRMKLPQQCMHILKQLK